jgi:hypothetical protein
VVHQVRVALQRVRFQAGEDAFRRAMLQRGLLHDLDRFQAATPSLGMRAEDDRIGASMEREKHCRCEQDHWRL